MRRPTTLELMLLATIGLWSLNLTVSRYILTHGLQPLAYGSVRYLLAAGVFCGITLVAERSLRIAGRAPLVRGRRARRDRLRRRGLRKPRRRAARRARRRDLGGVLDADHAADAPLLRVADLDPCPRGDMRPADA